MFDESKRKGGLVKSLLKDYYFKEKGVWPETEVEPTYSLCHMDEDVVSETDWIITRIEEAARRSAFEKYGIDPTVMSENQLKQLRDYYQIILEAILPE